MLNAIEQGDPHAAEQLLPLVYDELRQLAAQKLAGEKPGQTLQATALVHEACLRLVGSGGEQRWDGRRHFFAAAAEAMRRILINRARDRGRRGWRRLRLEHVDLSLANPPDDFLDRNEAVNKLAQVDPDCAELVKLRRFAGLTLERGDHLDSRAQDRAYASVFAEFGIDVQSLSAAELAARLGRHPAHLVRMAAALDDWAQARQFQLSQRNKDDPASWKRLLEAARRADPDPWRSQLPLQSHFSCGQATE